MVLLQFHSQEAQNLLFCFIRLLDGAPVGAATATAAAAVQNYYISRVNECEKKQKYKRIIVMLHTADAAQSLSVASWHQR